MRFEQATCHAPATAGEARPQKSPGAPGFFVTLADSSGALDVARLLALGAGGDIELHLLAFLERLESGHVDGGKMREKIFAAAIRRDEAETLRVIEPLHSTSCHLQCFLKNEKNGSC